MTKQLGNPSNLHDKSISVDDALKRLLQVHRDIFALFMERRKKHEPSQPTRIQTHVLSAIHEKPYLSISDVAALLSVSVPTASQLVTTMAERGWLTREVQPHNRRQYQIQLTPRGQALLRERYTHRMVQIKEILDQLTAEERMTLVTLAERLAALWHTHPMPSEGSSADGDR